MPLVPRSQRHILCLVALVYVASGACASPPRAIEASMTALPDAPARSIDEARAALVAEDLRGFVLIAADAPIFSTPSAAERAPRAPQRSTPLGPSSTPPPPPHVLAVEDTRGELMRVRTISARARSAHCASEAPAAMNALALTGWIHTRQLLPVLGQEQTRLYDDETAISLAAGTPVYEVTQAQRRLLAVSIGQRPYLLGADAPIAFAYQPTSFPEAQRPRGPVPHLPPDAVLWLDGRPLLRAEHLPGMLRVVRDRRIYSGDHLMLALSDACARLVVRGHTQQMRRIRAEAVAPRLLGGLGASRDREGAVHLPAQTPLRWEDGEPAGVTRTYLVITGTPRDDPARVCFEEVLPGAQTICVLRASLESREEAP